MRAKRPSQEAVTLSTILLAIESKLDLLIRLECGDVVRSDLRREIARQREVDLINYAGVAERDPDAE